ncbi:MAG TPA: C25 family cysteine peptidase, partial [Bacteroidota bacterium]|nr:C25 family cysteine peptidase [Bacteroidota bacterium]
MRPCLHSPVPRSVCLLTTATFLVTAVFTVTTGQTPSRTAAKAYTWGSVSVQNDGSGLVLSVRVNPGSVPTAAGAAGPSAPGITSSAGRIIQSTPVFPQYEFRIAVPPNATLRVGTTNIQTVAADPNKPLVLTGYQSAGDSSGVVPVYHSLAETGLIPAAPVLSVAGYEWFRGYRLARLVVSPYRKESSGFRIVTTVSARLEFAGGSSGSPRTESADPHFESVLKSLVANEDLSTVQKTKLTFADTTGGWIPWGMQAIKLGIAEDGVYRLSFEDIQSLVATAGTIDPTTFRLFNRGVEIPVYVAGEEDNQFNAGDYLEFPALRNYGRKDYRSVPGGNAEYPEYLDRYSDTSMYWLTWGGAKGLRMDSSGAVPASTDTLTWYTELVHVEQNTQLQFADGSNTVLRQDPLWTSGDIWGWGWLYSNDVFNVQFTASNVYAGYPTARIYARCASTTWPFSQPSYKVRLLLNSSDTLQKIDDNSTTPQILLQADAPIGTLVNGTNTIHVSSLPTTSSINQIWFDWAEAEYPRSLVAAGDTLMFGFPWVTGSAVRVVQVSGVSSPGVLVYKYSPQVKRITTVSAAGPAPYVIAFTDTVAPGDRYMLWTPAKVKSPQTKSVKTFPNLRDPSRKADYILITTNQFQSIANSYATFIGSADSLQTAVINVDDIFNEFGYGYPTAESIRDFLKATTNWQSPMPSYVFLVGDGTYDYKRYVANPNPANVVVNSVPTYGEPVSD